MTKVTKPKVQGYSIMIGLEKTLIRTIIIAGPLMLTILPEAWMNMTLGAVVTFLVNLAKNYDLDEKNQA